MQCEIPHAHLVSGDALGSTYTKAAGHEQQGGKKQREGTEDRICMGREDYGVLECSLRPIR